MTRRLRTRAMACSRAAGQGRGRVLILGAGVAGLGAATALHAAGREVLVLEQSEAIGGLSRTDDIRGFLFDQTGHYLHFRRPEVEQFFRFLGGSARETPAPVGGDARGQARSLSPPIQSLGGGESTRRKSLDGLLAARKAARQKEMSFEAAVRSNWGTALAELFFLPYHRKLWARPLNELPGDCVGRYDPSVDLDLVERGSHAAVAYDGYNRDFHYPASGRAATWPSRWRSRSGTGSSAGHAP